MGFATSQRLQADDFVTVSPEILMHSQALEEWLLKHVNGEHNRESLQQGHPPDVYSRRNKRHIWHHDDIIFSQGGLLRQQFIGFAIL